MCIRDSIGGEGVRQGDVFQQEVQGDAGEARSREQEFLFPAGEAKKDEKRRQGKLCSISKKDKQNIN